MRSPERRKPDYEPAQATLGAILKSIQDSLANDPRLSVDVDSFESKGHPLRVIRTARLSGIIVSGITRYETLDYIDIRTRQSPDDPKDPENMSVELVSGPVTTTYSLWHERAGYPVELGASFSLSKTLPVVDGGEQDTHGGLSDEEEDFMDFVDEQARSITPDDLELLGRLALALKQ